LPSRSYGEARRKRLPLPQKELFTYTILLKVRRFAPRFSTPNYLVYSSTPLDGKHLTGVNQFNQFTNSLIHPDGIASQYISSALHGTGCIPQGKPV